MDKYNKVLQAMAANAFENIEIAMMAISYWIVGTMSDAHLQDIMSRLGFTFNIATQTLNDGISDKSIYNLLTYCTDNLYASTKLTPEYIGLAIDACLNKEYITAEQAATLGGKL